nr:ABC transporter ATP-binding protein [uncultured Acetatifactor sp.]
MSEFAIQVKNLTKTYKLYQNNKRRIIEGLFPKIKSQHTEFHALKDVEFSIKKGEIVGIIGKNGSGKSTLLKIITGVLNPTSGSVLVEGRISALLELGAGFNPEYTGIENIYLNGTLNGITRDEMSRRIDDIARFADIGDFIHQPVKNYSSGMFVRLAFAVAVYSDPDILIVDEALAVGDAAFQAKCMARMNQIMRTGATVLFVTHDMNTVKRLCQRCIYLENGTKIMEGDAEELADIYLKRIRAAMNEEHLKLDQNRESIKKHSETEIENNNERKNIGSDEKIVDRVEMQRFENEHFIEKTRLFREGTGTVEFIDFKLLDENDKETYSFAFDQKMKLRILLKVNSSETFAVAYHIKDDKNMELLGSSTLRETGEMIQGESGEIYEIVLTTRLPVVEGNYNIMLLASRPVIENRTAMFLSLIENAAVFTVEENFKLKLWDKVYLKNEVNVKKLCRMRESSV